MEVDADHLDSEVLLPPRKRLLAGLKKQNSDSNAAAHVSSPANSSSDINARLNDLLCSHINKDLSPVDIEEVSRSAAIAAAKAAEAARVAKAVAEEKAAIAVRAMAAAKSALDLVASLSEGEDGKGVSPKSNKLKKHIPVQLLYKMHQPIENNQVDEELARKLHRAINSSPRISKKFLRADLNGFRNKKLKGSTTSGSKISKGAEMLEGDQHLTGIGHPTAGQLDSECSNRKVNTVNLVAKKSIHDKSVDLDTTNGKAEDGQSKEKSLQETYITGRKKGKGKLKKLPLSICNFKDRENPKAEMNRASAPSSARKTGSLAAGNLPTISQEHSYTRMPVESTSSFKCQDLAAPTCIKQNKVMQS